MREYSWPATESTIEAFRRLKAPWVHVAATPEVVAVTTAEEGIVLLSVERADVEVDLEASRLRADVVTPDDVRLAAAEDVPFRDLGLGRNDVVLFTGEVWTETRTGGDGDGAGAGAQVLQFSGRPGQRPASATAVCTTTDAVVVAASTGEGVLIRLGVRPDSLEVAHDRATIARFLVQRGYTADDDPR